ncbi:hypothetical protein O1611_g3724 [Lasiodiplodia mahajangana]|uniref:Uncharacterized protein n=1 Tax=Lasiodiplodia mahajangana TaxID=1108764 RepID=A0ACC2JQX8_9PEZI|nr:hypothetical protein O1611_g3724 [Lasiodiplodia mahajangana]
MADNSQSQNHILRRLQLSQQYKAIEGPTLSSLFPAGTNITRWSKINVLRGVQHEYSKLSDNVRNNAATNLEEAVRLRREAMPLWPAGTEAEARHWDWITILQRITGVLRTATNTAGVGQRNTIVSSTPTTIANDNTAWTDVDLDIYLEQMSYWRKTLNDIWEKARDDPEQMTVADISTGCAVRYFKMEMAAMYEGNRSWYGANASYARATLDYMKTNEGKIGHALWSLSNELETKTIPDLQGDISSADLGGFPAASDVWVYADRAKHTNPLVDWIKDIMTRVRGRKKTFNHHEFLTAWLFYKDAVEMAKEHISNMRRGAVKRLTELTRIAIQWPRLAPGPTVREVTEGIASRVAAMTRYVMRQDNIPGFAIAHSWASYLNLMMNVCLWHLPALWQVGLLFEAHLILKRWPKLPFAAKAEQFCNRYHMFICPKMGHRPADQSEWRQAVANWSEEITANNEQKGRLRAIMRDYARVDEFGKGWARLVVIEDSLTLTKDDFKMTQGTPQWWEAIRKKIQAELEEPPLTEMYLAIKSSFDNKQGRDWVNELLSLLPWEDNEEEVDAILDNVNPSTEWFSGVIDPSKLYINLSTAMGFMTIDTNHRVKSKGKGSGSGNKTNTGNGPANSGGRCDGAALKFSRKGLIGRWFCVGAILDNTRLGLVPKQFKAEAPAHVIPGITSDLVEALGDAARGALRNPCGNYIGRDGLGHKGAVGMGDVGVRAGVVRGERHGQRREERGDEGHELHLGV